MIAPSPSRGRVVLVQDLARALEVEVVLRGLVPGQRRDPVEVVRMTPYSAAARAASRAGRAHGRRPFFTSSRSSSSASRSRSSFTSACSASPSPSSVLDRLQLPGAGKYSRWPFSISDWTGTGSSSRAQRLSSSRFRINEISRSRAADSVSSSRCCFSSVLIRRVRRRDTESALGSSTLRRRSLVRREVGDQGDHAPE